MPKTVIPATGAPEITADRDTWNSRYARVGWTRATGERPGSVQVATCHVSSGLREPSADGASTVPGVLVDLDAARIDRLIEALHRARVAAFGPA
jgi:hypothetical protein